MDEPNFSEDGPNVYEGGRRAFVNNITGESVELTQCAVRSLTAARADLHQTAVQQLAGESVTVEQSVVLQVRGKDVSLRECSALAALGGTVSAENCRTVFLCSPSVSGNVQALITPRTAFAFGLGFFLGRQVMRLPGRILKRR
jgi:hypothetical protein